MRTNNEMKLAIKKKKKDYGFDYGFDLRCFYDCTSRDFTYAQKFCSLAVSCVYFKDALVRPEQLALAGGC